MSVRRHAQNGFEERISLGPFTHAQVTATTTVKLWSCPSGRDFQVDRVLYLNPTGLAADAANHFLGEVRQGAAIVAEVFDTNSAGGAALAADTFVEGALGAAADRHIAGGEALSLVLTETGIATLPAGSIMIEGRYVSG